MRHQALGLLFCVCACTQIALVALAPIPSANAQFTFFSETEPKYKQPSPSTVNKPAQMRTFQIPDNTKPQKIKVAMFANPTNVDVNPQKFTSNYQEENKVNPEGKEYGDYHDSENVIYATTDNDDADEIILEVESVYDENTVTTTPAADYHYNDLFDLENEIVHIRDGYYGFTAGIIVAGVIALAALGLGIAAFVRANQSHNNNNNNKDTKYTRNYVDTSSVCSSSVTSIEDDDECTTGDGACLQKNACKELCNATLQGHLTSIESEAATFNDTRVNLSANNARLIESVTESPPKSGCYVVKLACGQKVPSSWCASKTIRLINIKNFSNWSTKYDKDSLCYEIVKCVECEECVVIRAEPCQMAKVCVPAFAFSVKCNQDINGGGMVLYSKSDRETCDDKVLVYNHEHDAWWSNISIRLCKDIPLITDIVQSCTEWLNLVGCHVGIWAEEKITIECEKDICINSGEGKVAINAKCTEIPKLTTDCVHSDGTLQLWGKDQINIKAKKQLVLKSENIVVHARIVDLCDKVEQVRVHCITGCECHPLKLSACNKQDIRFATDGGDFDLCCVEGTIRIPFSRVVPCDSVQNVINFCQAAGIAYKVWYNCPLMNLQMQSSKGLVAEIQEDISLSSTTGDIALSALLGNLNITANTVNMCDNVANVQIKNLSICSGGSINLCELDTLTLPNTLKACDAEADWVFDHTGQKIQYKADTINMCDNVNMVEIKNLGICTGGSINLCNLSTLTLPNTLEACNSNGDWVFDHTGMTILFKGLSVDMCNFVDQVLIQNLTNCAGKSLEITAVDENIIITAPNVNINDIIVNNGFIASSNYGQGVLHSDNTGGVSSSKVVAADVNSGASLIGEVLTSDGSGNALWTSLGDSGFVKSSTVPVLANTLAKFDGISGTIVKGNNRWFLQDNGLMQVNPSLNANTARILNDYGTSTFPAYSFTFNDDPNGNTTGMWYKPFNLSSLNFSVQGTNLLEIVVNGNTISYQNFRPSVNNSFDLGDPLFQWRNIYGNVSYTPSTPANWNMPAPTNVTEALDRIAALLFTLNAGPIP